VTRTYLSSLRLFTMLILISPSILWAQTPGGPYTTDENTLLLMHFDGNTQDVASSLSIGDHGSAKSYVSSAMPGLGNAVHFDNSNAGNQSSLTVDHNNLLSLTGSWTIEFWLKIESWDQSHNNWPVPIVLPTTDWNANYYLEVPAAQSMLKYGFSGSPNGGVIYTDQNSVTTDTWYHVALMHDHQSNALQIQLRNSTFDVILDQSTTYPAGTVIETGHADLRIGTGIAGDNFLNGTMDELRISNIVRDFSGTTTPEPVLQSETNGLELYAPDSLASHITDLATVLQTEREALESIWNRPGLAALIPASQKIKIVLTTRDALLQLAGSGLQSWKCGWFNHAALAVYVCLPETQEQLDYYGSFEALTKGSLAQLLLKKRLLIQGNSTNRFDFFEGFGLYRGGYRPDQAQIQLAADQLGRIPAVSDIQDHTDLSNGYKKDLAVAYVEAAILSRWATYNLAPYMWDSYFQPYLEYYYLVDAADRIEPRYETDHFTLFSTPGDVQWLNAVASKLEEKLAQYSNDYEYPLAHRFSIVVFPNEAAGMALMNFDDGYNGGGGWGGDKLDILSPSVFTGGIEEATYSLIPHEFFHLFHHHFAYAGMPYGFYPEGMAELMAYGEDCQSYLENRGWYFSYAMQNFQNTYGRSPVLADFIADVDGSMSVYTFGMAFFHLLHENYADYVTIRQFFEQNMNWDVFDASYDEIEAGYMNYLNILGGLTTIDGEPVQPYSLTLSQNYPNPFNPNTQISFSIPETNFTQLVVFDVKGQEVKRLLNRSYTPGNYQISLSGEELNAGVYIYKLISGKHSVSRKMVLIK